MSIRFSASANGTRNAPENVMNLVTDFGAIADGQRQTLTVSISNGSPTLTVPSGVFSVADQTKSITIWHSNFGGTGGFNSTINTYTAGGGATDTLTLANNSTAALSSASCDVLWGTDNAAAFTGASGSWRAWAQTQSSPASTPILEIPDGDYAAKFSALAGASINYGILNNVKIRSVSGVAANVKLMNLGLGEMRFGHDPAIVSNRALTNSGGNSARLQTASAGATTATLVDSVTYGSRIVVGRACLLAAFDMQGTYESVFGYPPNSFFYEWNVIAGYSGGVITFQNPLSQDYKSTYPRWGSEDSIFGSDQGGPFTIWVAPDGYNNTITLENFTVDNAHNQSACHVRHVVLNGLVMTGPALYPTQNDTFTANSCVYPNQLEVDKMTNVVTWNNCTLNRLQQQSASPNRSILNGGTIQILETAKYTEANNVAFTGSATLRIGTTSYGRSDRFVGNGCTDIAVMTRGGVSTDDLNGSSGPSDPQMDASDYYTFNAGVIRFLKSSNDGAQGAGNSGQQNITRGFVPGTWITFDDKYIDQVTDVYEDGTYCYVEFANTTDWPFTPVSRLKVHPCPDFTMIDCTGVAPELRDWNNATPRLPYYSYTGRTYTETLGTGGSEPAPSTLGELTATDAMSVDVTTAYTGVGALTWRPSQFATQVRVWRAGAQVSLDLAINAKIAGTRTYNGATQTWSGGQTGDTLPAFQSGDFYITTQSTPTLSANVNGQGLGPVLRYEIKTDQGI